MHSNLPSTSASPHSPHHPTPVLLTIPRLKKKIVNNMQQFMEHSKKDRLHYPHHNFIPNSLKMNTEARTTVIQLFRTSSPFTLEVAFGHTIRNLLRIHVMDGSANIRCAREIDNTIIDTEAPFTSSWAVTKELLDHYRITLRPLKYPLLLIMEEIHKEAPCPLPTIWPIQQPLYLPDRTDNQDYVFISVRWAYTDAKMFPVSISLLGNKGETLLNTLVCPREFVKHMTTDTHDLKEDDLMRGMDHYLAYPLIKASLHNKTVVGFKTKKLLDDLQMPLDAINTYVDLKNLTPTTSHYTEYRLPHLIQRYLDPTDYPSLPIKDTLVEATTIRKIFTQIKTQFAITNTAKNPFTLLASTAKEITAERQFKIPSFPATTKKASTVVPVITRKVILPEQQQQRRKNSPITIDNPNPPKNRKVVSRAEDPFAELDGRACNQEDSRTVILSEHQSAGEVKIIPTKPFPRPTKTLGHISIKQPEDVKKVSNPKVLTQEELSELRQQRKPESCPIKKKDILPPTRPVGPQKVLEHPITLMGLIELNTNSFLAQLEASSTKKEAMTPTQERIEHPTEKDDPATIRMKKIKDYVTKREDKLPDPGHPSVTPNGYYARATADYDDSRFTWDYFVYIQYFEEDYPKSLLYSQIPPIPKMPDCGIMEILYVPVQYRHYPLKNLYLLSSYIIREYRNAAKVRTYSLFTRKIQPPLIQ